MTTSNRSSLVDLLNQARGGDVQARDRLFAKCRNYLVVVAQAEAGNWLRAKVDPSDIVQQTLLDAHRGLGDFRGSTEAEWLGWLRRILSHNAADYVRHYLGTEKRDAGAKSLWGHAGSEPRLGVAPEPAAPDATPSQLMARRELELQVADAIAQLPGRLSRGHCAAEPGAAAVRRSRPADGAFAAGRANALAAHDSDGARIRCRTLRLLDRTARVGLWIPTTNATSGNSANRSTPTSPPCRPATNRLGTNG